MSGVTQMGAVIREGLGIEPLLRDVESTEPVELAGHMTCVAFFSSTSISKRSAHKWMWRVLVGRRGRATLVNSDRLAADT